jgi:hypothetical protein
MASVTFHGSAGASSFDLPNPDNIGRADYVIIKLPYQAHQDRPAARQGLCSKIVRGVFNHSGKIALVASALIVASQTEIGAKILTDLVKEATQFAADNYEPFKKAIVDTATEAVQFGKANLPDINAALSVIWAVPNAFRAGSKKMKAFWLLAGAASAAVPYAMAPGFTIQGALDRASKLGSTALAILQGNNTIKGDL